MNSENPPPTSNITKAIFLLFGIGALLAYNAFLTELSFFKEFLEDLSPSKTIPFLNFTLNITFQFLIIWKKDLFNLKKQLIIGLICSILFLILIPLIVVTLEKNSLENMITTSILILIMGFINALLTSGFYALASFFPTEIVVSLNTGMAIAGILMNFIQYMVLIFVNTGNKEKDIKICALTFFSISGLILLLCLIILLFQFKTEYFKFYLKSLEKNGNENNTGKITDSVKTEEANSELIPNKNKEENELTFMEMFKILKDVDLLGMYIYIITASLYPSLIISLKLFEMEEAYMMNTILIIVNTCDTIGRYMVVRVTPTKRLTYIVVLSRTILLATCFLNYYLQQRENITYTSFFVIFNVIALAISNGVGTSLCFGIAPILVDEKYKGQAGASVSFFSTLGTFTGTILAFLTTFIMSLMKVETSADN